MWSIVPPVMESTGTASLNYPASGYTVAPPLDLSERRVRARLSAGAVGAFLNIMARWGVRDADARQLLGGLSNGAFYALKKRTGRTLDEDKLYRISYLVGIFEALNMLYSEELADQWVLLPNNNRIFAGITPLQYLVRGGQPALATVRKLLDARRGGA